MIPFPALEMLCLPQQLRFSLLSCFFFLAGNSTAKAADLHLLPQRRQPVALVVQHNSLYVANKHAGTVAKVDWQQGRVISEWKIGNHISDLVELSNRQFLAIDESSHQLILISSHKHQLLPVIKMRLAQYPVAITVAANQTFCCVTSLWSQRVSVIPLKKDGNNQIAGFGKANVIDLSFAPRCQCLINSDQQLLVAGAFAGQMAVLDVPQGILRDYKTLDAHNLRGLTLSRAGDEVFVSHQVLRGHVETTGARISWGGVLDNVLRAIPISEFLEGKGKATPAEVPSPITRWKLVRLGEQGRAGGDPGAITFFRDGRIATVLSGVHEVAIVTAFHKSAARISVGQRPTQLAVNDSENALFVVNEFDDTISVIDLTTQQLIRTIQLGPTRQVSVREHGEHLFFDARLALDGWFSCHSCHTDGHTNSLLNDNLGDHTFGAPKRIPSLLGVAQTSPWGWNGQQHSLEQQLLSSLKTTMRGPTEMQAGPNLQALKVYLQSLPPAPSLRHSREESNVLLHNEGRRIFELRNCHHCHSPPYYTSELTYDVGLSDEWQQSEFNPPSLRGLSQRSSFFHDGRAKTLTDIFYKFNHADSNDLSANDFQALLEFLSSL